MFRHSAFPLVLSVSILVMISGCGVEGSGRRTSVRVVLMGADARVSVLESIANEYQTKIVRRHDKLAAECAVESCKLQLATSEVDPAAESLRLEAADVAVLVIDAGQYEPMIFERCAQLLGECPSVQCVLLFANTAGIRLQKSDAIELLELTELDVRELLNQEGLDGDNVAWFYDSRNIMPTDFPPIGTSLNKLVAYLSD